MHRHLPAPAAAPRRGPRRRLSSLLLALLLAALLPPALPTAAPARAQASPWPFGPPATTGRLSAAWGLAWGDMDNDGDLDLAIGNFEEPSQIYRNEGGSLALVAGAIAGAAPTRAVAWGDADGDGDLDLALANQDDGAGAAEPSRVLRSCAVANPGCAAGQLFAAAPLWQAAVTGARSVAWGDDDNDGDLDLLIGSQVGGAQIFRNQGGAIQAAPVRVAATPTATTLSVAWGDVDGDGDLDLAVGNDTAASQLYRNCTLGPSAAGCAAAQPGSYGPPLELAESTQARSAAWGDMDNDGDLDLLLGRQGAESRLFLGCRVASPGCSGAPLAPYAGWQPSPAETYGAALGDLDGDGDLDLALANEDAPAQIYRNGCAGAAAPCASIFPDPPGEAPANTRSRGAAWGDVDGDGDLDLALANEGQRSQIYRNPAAPLLAGPAQRRELPASPGGRSVAWGDLNNDGDLDLALGAERGASKLFRNCAVLGPGDVCANPGGLALDAAWRLDLPASQQVSLAWGDIDSDGDLDLAAGVEPDFGSFVDVRSRVYRNCTVPNPGCAAGASGLSALLAWTAPKAASTQSVAWADFEGDGDLDLLLANQDRSPDSNPAQFDDVSQIFRNCTARQPGDGCVAQAPTLSAAPVWSAGRARTNAAAWGDVDGDGDLDLALANNAGPEDVPSQLYLNQDGALTLDERWAPEPSPARSLAWGDLDGDGDLDLALGNDNAPSQIYRNQGGLLSADPRWSPDPARTYGLALGDADGDGDLDIAQGNRTIGEDRQLNRLYLNDGAGVFTRAAWLQQQSEAQSTYGVAWGDLDGDGGLDLAVANQEENARVYLGRRSSSASPAGRPPRLRVEWPRLGEQSAGAGGGPLAAGRIVADPVIAIPFTLADPEGDPARAVVGQYSLDGGASWRPAQADGPALVGLAAPAGGQRHTFRWDTFTSGFFGQSDSVVLRLIALPALSSGRLAGPYQIAAVAAAGQPFRARGTQVQVVDDTGQPVAGAIVYRQPAGSEIDGASLLSAAGGALTTDGRGFLRGRGVLGSGDRLAALAELDVADAGPARYYFTSPISRASGQPGFTVGAPGVQRLTIDSANPLIVFDLSVSIEWDARRDGAFLNQLRADLRRTADLLYDWTDGQATLGAITLLHDRERWSAPGGAGQPRAADVRIYATNRLRPNADRGGITLREREDPVQPAGDPDDEAPLVYRPGQLRIGATWTRFGAAAGTLGEDWPRTLAHELGHYALYLDDNYIGFAIRPDGSRAFIPVTSCRGAMADPYREDYSELHPPAEWDARCAETLSNRSTGRSDWETFATFYQPQASLNGRSLAFRLNVPGQFDAQPGPSGLALNLVEIRDQPRAEPPATLAAPIFGLVEPGVSGPRPYRPDVGSQTRAIRYADGGASVVDLGRPSQDLVNARGAREGDEICVYDLPRRLLGCAAASDGLGAIALYSRPDWRPEPSIVPGKDNTLRVSLPAAGVGQLAAGQRLRARFYPIDRPGLFYDVAALPLVSGRYEGATAPLTVTANFGYLRLWVEGEAASRREAIVDVAIVGNLGAGGAILQPHNGCPLINHNCSPAPIAVSVDGQIALYGRELELAAGKYYLFQTAATTPAAPPWATPVGQSYRLETSLTAAELARAEVAVNISYLEGELPPGTEGGLGIYFWDGRGWAKLETIRRDPERNEITARVAGPGLYALMTSLDLRAGWNIFSYPWPGRASGAPEEGVAAALARLNVTPAHYTAVYGYEPGDEDEPWKLYDPAAPAWVSRLDGLRYGQGYWINVTAAGAAPGAGAALAALPTPPATIYGVLEAAPGYTPAVGQAVQATIGGAACGSARSEEQLVDGARRVVVRLTVPAADAARPGCGLPGRVVELRLAGAGGSPGRQIGAVAWSNERAINFNQARPTYLPLLSR